MMTYSESLADKHMLPTMAGTPAAGALPPSPCNAWKRLPCMKHDSANFPELLPVPNQWLKKARLEPPTDDAPARPAPAALAKLDAKTQAMAASLTKQLKAIKKQGEEREELAKACIAGAEHLHLQST